MMLTERLTCVFDCLRDNVIVLAGYGDVAANGGLTPCGSARMIACAKKIVLFLDDIERMSGISGGKLFETMKQDVSALALYGDLIVSFGIADRGKMASCAKRIIISLDAIRSAVGATRMDAANGSGGCDE